MVLMEYNMVHADETGNRNRIVALGCGQEHEGVIEAHASVFRSPQVFHEDGDPETGERRQSGSGTPDRNQAGWHLGDP